MASTLYFTMQAEPAPVSDGEGGMRDGVNDMLGTVFAAQGGPFQIESRTRTGGVGHEWAIQLAGTIPQGARAGLITALEATQYAADGSARIEDT